MEWKEADGVRWLGAQLSGATAVFTTRAGGVSTGAFAGLNLGFTTPDRGEAVRENRVSLAGALGLDPADVLLGCQVHGAEVERHEDRIDGIPYLDLPTNPPEADGHVTAKAGLAPMVVVADCLPVALSGPHGVAMLHCGWRGLAAAIIERGVMETGATAAAIGPGIGPCCFEVGPEVPESFAPLGPGMTEGRMLDLPEVAERQLRAADVESVERANLCTSCNPDLFFSHRRDGGTTGRQAGIVWAWPS